MRRPYRSYRASFVTVVGLLALGCGVPFVAAGCETPQAGVDPIVAQGDAGVKSSSDASSPGAPPLDGATHDAFANASDSAPAPLCTNTQTDPMNCGVCGRTCLRGACTAGVCDPVTVSVFAPARIPSSIAVDATGVYWFNGGTSTTTDTKSPQPNIEGSVETCRTSGCGDGGPTVLVGAILSDSYAPSPVSVDGTNVYFSWLDPSVGETEALMACAKTGCNGTPTHVVDTFLEGLAADTTHVYWSDDTGLFDLACPGGSCAGGPATVWTPQVDAAAPDMPAALAIDDANLYWVSDEQKIESCPKTGCGAGGPTTYGTVSVPDVTAVVVSADNVYWLTRQPLGLGQIFMCPKTGCGLPFVVANGLSSALGLATDGTNVYWTEFGDYDPGVTDGGGVGTGSVSMCPVNGCYGNPTRLATGLQFPGAIAADAHDIYFAVQGGLGDAGAIEVIAK